MSNKSLGKRLKEYREKKFPNMGLRKVAEMKIVDTHFVYLHRIEKGTFIPSNEKLAKLCDAYDLSDDEKSEVFFLAKRVPKEIENFVRNNPDKLQ